MTGWEIQFFDLQNLKPKKYVCVCVCGVGEVQVKLKCEANLHIPAVLKQLSKSFCGTCKVM